MNVEPQKEHLWLQKLIGEWTYETEPEPPEADKPGEVYRGTESVRALGPCWIVAEGQGEMCGGGSVETVITLGFDPQKGRFTGTWVGSIMTMLWVYQGDLEADGRKLNLDSEGPSFSGDGSIAKYRDVIEFVSDDHRILRSLTQNETGEWYQFMATHYYRKN